MDVVPNLATSYVGAKRTKIGDMVLNKLKAHLGVFALSAYDGLVSPDYAVYYGTGRADLEYLEYLFKTPLYVSEFIKKTTGVAIDSIVYIRTICLAYLHIILLCKSRRELLTI